MRKQKQKWSDSHTVMELVIELVIETAVGQ